ncbi:MAG: tetratricopeptide repeat protein [Pseudomonadota bacterium]
MAQDTPEPADSPQEITIPFQLGEWRVDPESGEIATASITATLEPQLMALLIVLAGANGRVVSRERIEHALWPRAVVSEDTLARTVSRLRRALGDSAQAPRYIETLPKRGYRLLQDLEFLHPHVEAGAHAQGRSWQWLAGLGAALALVIYLSLPRSPSSPAALPPLDPLDQQVGRANDLYMRFTRADNEAAIGLYERVLAQSQDHAGAQAGLANALVQRVVRWPRGDAAAGANSLTEALNRGLHRGVEAEAVLERAVAMAERAVRIAPDDPDALKALAFAYSAQGEIERAEAIYQQVLSVNADAWPALVNLGEIALMDGDRATAVAYFERAWDAMGRAYRYEPQRVGPWQVALGVITGQLHEELGHPVEAESWYRQVLEQAPFEPEATVRLAQLLAAGGQPGEARILCAALENRVGNYPGCAL